MVELLNIHYEKLKKIFEELLEIKNSEVTKNVAAKRTNAALLFVALKNSNRYVKYKIKDGREELCTKKSKADVYRLHLQNLLYEANHLKREIVQCHKFKSRDSSINLLSDTEYMEFGGDMSKEVDHNTIHSKHLLRLKCELNLRKQLALNYKVLMASKGDLAHEILLKTDRYASLAPALGTLHESTRPLHDALQMTIEQDWKLAALVQYLPQPLYMLYMNLKALQRVQKELNLSIEIVGSESNIFQKELEREHSALLKINGGVNRDTNETLSSEPHSLSISFSIGKTGWFDKIVVTVYYFESLGFATAYAELVTKDSLDIIRSELPSTKNILAHLYCNDFGNEIPLSEINYKFKKNGLDRNEFLERLKSCKFGRPYKWLQNVCCSNAFNLSKNNTKYDSFLQECTEVMIFKIKDRYTCWMKLIKQLRGLVYKDVDLNVLQENNYPGELSCSLVQCSSITADEFNNQKSDALNCLPERENVIYSYFRAVIVRGSAKLESFIRISSNYPRESPLWLICVHWNGKHTSSKSTAIKVMEFWTNSLKRSQLETKSGLLYTQLFRTMFSFDIFLETEGCLQSTIEYNKEKPYISAFSKRIRQRPYKFIRKGTVFSFKQ